MQRNMLLRYPRTTTTGVLLWVSTSTVSLPSTIAETPRRPWEAITIASHPFFLAVSIIASYGCSCSTCTTSQGTLAAVAASFAAWRYFEARAAACLLYSAGVSVTILGSTAKTWKGSDTVTAVTLAWRGFCQLNSMVDGFLRQFRSVGRDQERQTRSPLLPSFVFSFLCFRIDLRRR